MPYIYKITNDINNKLYIGKTTETIEERWRLHLSDSQKERCKDRILYRAMNKYGIEHFHIELIEKVDANILNEREIYWINYYDSFKNGYNATKGGDGTSYLDYNLIFKTWQTEHSIKKTAKIIGCHEDSVLKVLKMNNISSEEINEDRLNQIRKPILQLDKSTEKILNHFNSIAEALIFLNKPNGKHNIIRACQNKNHTAYGYKWRYENDMRVYSSLVKRSDSKSDRM